MQSGLEMSSLNTWLTVEHNVFLLSFCFYYSQLSVKSYVVDMYKIASILKYMHNL